GADIPDIELIIQFGMPSSLSVWVQRAGRAGRSPELHARAILLAKAKPAPEPDSSDSDSSSNSDGDEPAANNVAATSTAAVDPEDDGKEWGKQVDPALREYICSIDCRRDATDRYFDNPPHCRMSRLIRSLLVLMSNSAPTGECCNNCTVIEQQKQRPSQPQTPEPPDESTPSSAQSTPSKKRNANGKRTMLRGNGPKTRRKEHLSNARSALQRWRINTYLSSYSYSSFTPEVLLPDQFLTSLASHRVQTVPDLCALVPAWAFTDEHAAAVLRVLSRIDEAERAKQERAKQARKAVRSQATLATRAERARQAAENVLPPK
ncbi:hypothetical protein DFH07DRAFT_754207, partial [Mycena maculata]